MNECVSGKPVLISVSVVVSNVRAVSEVTMVCLLYTTIFCSISIFQIQIFSMQDYNLEMFYRESWVDERLRYNIRHFRNKTVLALHESYAVKQRRCIFFVFFFLIF